MNTIIEIDGVRGTYEELVLGNYPFSNELGNLNCNILPPDGIEFVRAALKAFGRGRIIQEFPDDEDLPEGTIT